MTEGQSGVDVLLKTINNEAMTNLTGTPMYMSPNNIDLLIPILLMFMHMD